MADKLYNEASIQAIADAIRAKSGKTDTMKVSEMAGEIAELGKDTYTIDEIVTDGIIGGVKLKDTTTHINSLALRNRKNITSIIGEGVTMIDANGCSDMWFLTEANFPNLEEVYSYSFANDYFLRRVNAPKLKIVRDTYRTCYGLALADLGVVTTVSSYCFNGSDALVAVFLRSTSVASLANLYVFQGTKYAAEYTYNLGDGYIYVPRNLISSYQTATNWANLYAAHPNMFRAIEDYTKDGTITGEIDEDKIFIKHTPSYTLFDKTLDGKEIIDTGIQLFDGTNNNAFSIAIDFTITEWTNNSRLLWCCDGTGGSNGYGFWLGRHVNNNNNYSGYLNPPNSEKTLLLNPAWGGSSGNRFRTYLIFNGTNLWGYTFKTWVVPQTFTGTMSGNIDTISNTLHVGGTDMTNYGGFKGTIHSLAVYKGVAVDRWEVMDFLAKNQK